jgi:hypothetical protein
MKEKGWKQKVSKQKVKVLTAVEVHCRHTGCDAMQWRTHGVTTRRATNDAERRKQSWGSSTLRKVIGD